MTATVCWCIRGRALQIVVVDPHCPAPTHQLALPDEENPR